MKKYLLYIIICLVCPLMGQAQTLLPLTYNHYLEKVSTGNLGYAAERLNVSAAKADAIAAKVFNDPELSIDYGYNQDRTLQMGQSVDVGITQTLSLGKRGANIKLARSESELAEALLADYLRNLRAEATIAFLDVQKQMQLCNVKKNFYQNIYELAKSDSIWFASGKITEVEAIQSKLEFGIMHNEWMQTETDLKNAYISLSLMTGTVSADTLFVPQGLLPMYKKEYVLNELIDYAIDNRSDLVAALKNSEVARRALTVARKEKLPDINISLAISHNSRVRNEEAPAPPFRGITAGIAFPLNFSAFNKGSVNAAQARMQQAELQYEQARLQVQAEVIKAFHQYQSLSKQVQYYEKDMLTQAKSILDGKMYSYLRGEVPLLEYLNTQRTYDDIQAQYIETLYNYNVALVELEKVSGIWSR